MLKYRLIFGPIMIAGLLGIFYADDLLDQIDLTGTWGEKLFLGREYLPAGLLMLVVFLALITLGTQELIAIFRAKGLACDRFMVWLGGTLGCVLMYLIPFRLDSQNTVAIYATITTIVFLLALIRYAVPEKRTDGAVAVAGTTLMAMVYFGTLPGFYLAIRRWHSAWVIVGVFLIIKFCDIGAYFTGRSLGKHKMIPWLSPKKTWEGLAGGLIASGLMAMLLAWIGGLAGITGHFDSTAGDRVFYAAEYPLWFAALAGALLGGVGQMGDLVASLFKRDAGIKDSGHSIPGFGGVLDVLDSPIVAAPFAYWLLRAASSFGG